MSTHELTPRECEVLDLARRGLSNEAIALQLGISRNAVRYHLKLHTGAHPRRYHPGSSGLRPSVAASYPALRQASTPDPHRLASRLDVVPEDVVDRNCSGR